MAQDILITPGSGEPQILFRGSGTNDTPIELNVLSSYQSANGSGSALLFEGTEGQLFAITDNLSSGVIFSVAGAAGLPFIEADASGDVRLIEYGRYVGVGTGTPAYQLDVFGTGRFSEGILFGDGTSQTTAASGGGGSSPTGTASGVAFFGGDNNLTESSKLVFTSGGQGILDIDNSTGILRVGRLQNTVGTQIQLSVESANSYFVGGGGSNNVPAWQGSRNAGFGFADGWPSILHNISAGTVGVEYNGGGPNYFIKGSSVTVSLGNSSRRWDTTYSTLFDGYRINLENNSSSSVVATVKGAASQSANLQEWQDSAGTLLTSVNENGYIEIGTGTVSATRSFIVHTGSAYFPNTIYVGEQYGVSANGGPDGRIYINGYDYAGLEFNSHTSTSETAGWTHHRIYQGINSALIFDDTSNPSEYGFEFRCSSLVGITNDAIVRFQDGIGIGNGSSNTTAGLIGSSLTTTNEGSRTHDLKLAFRQSTNDNSLSGRFIFTKEGDFSATGNINALYGTVTASSGVFNTGEINKLTVDNGTASAFNVSGTSLLAGTGVVLQVKNTGGDTLFAVEDTNETIVVVNAQVGQTSYPFEVRDEFGITAAYVDVSGNVSGNSISFGDGTTQTTAATASGPASVISDTGTGITMVCGTHANNYLRTTSNSAVTITFTSGLGCDANSEFTFEQAGSGQITVTGDAGVTINTSSTTKSYTQFSVISMKQVATDTYTLFGDTASF